MITSCPFYTLGESVRKPGGLELFPFCPLGGLFPRISLGLRNRERAGVWLGALLGRLSKPVMLALEQVLSTWRQREKLRQLNVMVKT